jgi:hypothetical protein
MGYGGFQARSGNSLIYSEQILKILPQNLVDSGNIRSFIYKQKLSIWVKWTLITIYSNLKLGMIP